MHRQQKRVLRFALRMTNPEAGASLSRRSLLRCFLPGLRRQRSVGFRTPVAIELPDPSYFLNHVEIEIGDQHLIFVPAGLGDDLAARIAEVALAVKLADIPWRFPAHTINRTDEVSVGGGVRRLLEFP